MAGTMQQEGQMQGSPATPRDLEYPTSFFQDRDAQELPEFRHLLLGGLVGSFAAAAISGIPVFWLVRMLRKRAGLRGQRFLFLLYGPSVLCGLALARGFVFLSRIQALYHGPDWRDVERRARAMHERAQAVILAAEAGSGRFALFVRTFDHERDLPNLFPWGTYVNRWTLEQRLAKVLQGHLPAVALASPGADAAPEFVESEILRLFVDTDQWQHVFRRLAAAAALIIVLDEHGGPGLLYELSVIDELQRGADTVVLTDEDFHVLSFGFGDGKDFALEDYEDKVAIIRTARKEEEAELGPEREPATDPKAAKLIAEIAENAESGLLRLRDIFSSGRF